MFQIDHTNPHTEAHRFAIEYHRARRGKAQIHSVLDDIEVLGPARRKALMCEFKGIHVSGASVRELAAIPDTNRNVAKVVYVFSP